MEPFTHSSCLHLVVGYLKLDNYSNIVPIKNLYSSLELHLFPFQYLQT